MLELFKSSPTAWIKQQPLTAHAVAARALLREVQVLDPERAELEDDWEYRSRFALAYFRTAFDLWERSLTLTQYDIEDAQTHGAREQYPLKPAVDLIPKTPKNKVGVDIEHLASVLTLAHRELQHRGPVDCLAILERLALIHRRRRSANLASFALGAMADVQAMDLLNHHQAPVLKLFPGKIGPDFTAAWARIKQELLDRHEGWQVWIDWYERRLRGQAHAHDKAFTNEVPWERRGVAVGLPWERGALAVNAAIADIISTIESKKPSNSPPFDVTGPKEAVSEAQSRISAAETVIGMMGHAQIGHNNPPTSTDQHSEDERRLNEAVNKLNKLRSELAEVREKLHTAKRALAAGIMNRIKKLGKVALIGILGGIGTQGGKMIGERYLPELTEVVTYLLNSAAEFVFAFLRLTL